MTAFADPPIRPEVVTLMKEVAAILAETFHPFGFALLVFDMGKEPNHGFINYLSNANRDDMCTAMQDFINRTRSRQ